MDSVVLPMHCVPGTWPDDAEAEIGSRGIFSVSKAFVNFCEVPRQSVSPDPKRDGEDEQFLRRYRFKDI